MLKMLKILGRQGRWPRLAGIPEVVIRNPDQL
jgi:hypothetical protein